MVKKATNGKTAVSSNSTLEYIAKPSAMNVEDIKINETFRKFLPPLTPAELDELLAKIRREGFTEPIYIWAGRGELLDGHHRLCLWRKYFKKISIRPQIIEVELADEMAAFEWILLQQRSGRKLSQALYVESALKLKPMFAAQAAKQQGIRLRVDEGQQPVDALAAIAKLAGVSRATVGNVEYVLNHGTPDVIEAMRCGDLAIKAAYNAVKEKAGAHPNRESDDQADAVAVTATDEDTAAVSGTNQQAETSAEPADKPAGTSGAKAARPGVSGRKAPSTVRDTSPMVSAYLSDRVNKISRDIHDLNLELKRRQPCRSDKLSNSIEVLGQTALEISQIMQQLSSVMNQTEQAANTDTGAAA